jgi:hypothetical protein
LGSTRKNRTPKRQFPGIGDNRPLVALASLLASAHFSQNSAVSTAAGEEGERKAPARKLAGAVSGLSASI